MELFSTRTKQFLIGRFQNTWYEQHSTLNSSQHATSHPALTQGEQILETCNCRIQHFYLQMDTEKKEKLR